MSWVYLIKKMPNRATSARALSRLIIAFAATVVSDYQILIID
jgi:hypothetical protein